MESVKVTDEWLYKYMPVLDSAIINKLESQVNTEYEFSSKFKHRMRRLINQESHPWLREIQNIRKQVAVFLIVMIGTTFLFTMSVEAYREKFFETVKTIWEDSILYSYLKSMDTEEFQIHEPGYIPEGYRETERIEVDTLFSVVYENSIGEMITWDQMLVLNGGSLVVDSEYDSQITKVIYGDEVIISLYSDGYIGAYYEHGEYAYMLTADNLSAEEVCLMLESMQK
ncbi:MAG: DUF4367 domain-containing protein [Agathobacter sp.]